MIDTQSSPHVCTPMYDGNCWCRPRRNSEIALSVAISRNLTLRGAVALLREIRGDNVVRLSEVRRARRRV